MSRATSSLHRSVIHYQVTFKWHVVSVVRNSITECVNDLSGMYLFACINLIQSLICDSNSFKPSEISHSYQMDGYWLVFYICI